VLAPTVNLNADIAAYEHINIGVPLESANNFAVEAESARQAKNFGDTVIWIGSYTGSNANIETDVRRVFSMDPQVNFFGKIEGLTANRYTLDIRALGLGAPNANTKPPEINIAADVGLTNKLVLLNVVSGNMTGFQRVTDSFVDSEGSDKRTSQDKMDQSEYVKAGSASIYGKAKASKISLKADDVVRRDSNGQLTAVSDNDSVRNGQFKSSSEQMDQVLDSRLSVDASVEVGDLIEEQCDRDDNDNCRIPLPIQISQNP
jgi:hypothetical protein